MTLFQVLDQRLAFLCILHAGKRQAHVGRHKVGIGQSIIQKLLIPGNLFSTQCVRVIEIWQRRCPTAHDALQVGAKHGLGTG